MPINKILPLDYLNTVKDKFNGAVDEIPVTYPIVDGNILVNHFGGAQIVIPLKNYFVTLDQAFEELTAGLASLLNPGLVQYGDDENTQDLDSEQRVLSAAATIRQITKIVQEKIEDIQAAVTTHPDRYDLWKTINSISTIVSSLRLNDDGTVSLTYGDDDVINFNGTSIRLNSDSTLVAAFLKADNFGIINPDPIEIPDFVTGLLYDSGTGTYKVGKITKADYIKWLGVQKIDCTSDVCLSQLTIKNPIAGTDIPDYFYARDKTTGKVGEYTIDRLVSYILANVNQSGESEDDQWAMVYAGCRQEAQLPQLDQEIVFDNVPIGVSLTHNLQTTGDNISVEGVKTFVPEGYWVRDQSFSRMFEFPTSDTIRYRSDATPDLASSKVKVILKREIPLS